MNEQLKKYKADWYKAHRDPVREKEWREQNKETNKMRQKKWRDNIRDDPIRRAQYKEYKRIWYLNRKSKQSVETDETGIA